MNWLFPPADPKRDVAAHYEIVHITSIDSYAQVVRPCEHLYGVDDWVEARFKNLYAQQSANQCNKTARLNAVISSASDQCCSENVSATEYNYSTSPVNRVLPKQLIVISMAILSTHR